MTYTAWLDSSGALLGPLFPLPLDQPFTRDAALAAGCGPRDLSGMLAENLIRRVVRGVFAAAQAPDSVRFRATALGLVVPEHAIVTDRAAGWLHGMPVLRKGAHLEAPPIELCFTTDSRSIRPEVDGRRRMLAARDVMELHGIRLTTPLRTALDLGRLARDLDAIAALDAALALGVDHEQMIAECDRFKGFRGVVQLRALVPLADGRAESPGESALRLWWHRAGLPWPTPQVVVVDDWGREVFMLDLGLPEVRYAAEYDGVEFHTAEADVQHDHERRTWIRTERGWVIDAFTKEDVYRPGTKIEERLQAGFSRARRSLPTWRA